MWPVVDLLGVKAKVLKVAFDSSEQNMRVNLARDGEESDTHSDMLPLPL